MCVFLLSHDLLQRVFLIDKNDYPLCCQSTLDKNQIHQIIDIFVRIPFKKIFFFDPKRKWIFSKCSHRWKIWNFQKLFKYIINVTTKNFRSFGLSKSVQGRPKVEDKKRSFFIIFIHIQRPQNKTLTHGIYITLINWNSTCYVFWL